MADENSYAQNTKDKHPVVLEFSDLKYTPTDPSEVLRFDEPAVVPHIYGLMQAVLHSSERSSRTHRLATVAIQHNQSNPTAWVIRRQSAEALAKEDKSVWEKEMAFCAQIITNSAKNFQAWEYRRFCATKFGHQHEREFADIVLAEDEKNYHAWAHRAWLVRNGLIKAELEATEWYIARDLRNNSAWNHRWVVLTLTGVLEERGEEEMQFALSQMKLADRNEAVWNFIQALYDRGFGCEIALKAAREATAADEMCLPARRFLVWATLKPGKEGNEDVKKHCAFLAEKDLVRRKYWQSLIGDAEEQ